MKRWTDKNSAALRLGKSGGEERIADRHYRGEREQDTSLATNIYVREIASNQDELTSTLSTGISINHLIAILSAPLGGWVWQRYGIGVLFSFAAVMAVCNSLFAATLPKPKKCL